MEFLRKSSLCAFLFMLFFCSNEANSSHEEFRRLQSSSSKLLKNLFRTEYHFQPPKHWINGMYTL